MWFTVPASLYLSAIFDNSPSAILFILFSFIAEVCYRLVLDILFNCLIDSRALNLLVNVRSVLLRVINGLRNRLLDCVCSLPVDSLSKLNVKLECRFLPFLHSFLRQVIKELGVLSCVMLKTRKHS